MISQNEETAVPYPYNIILGRDTALPSPLSCLSATGIDITGKSERNCAHFFAYF